SEFLRQFALAHARLAMQHDHILGCGVTKECAYPFKQVVSPHERNVAARGDVALRPTDRCGVWRRLGRASTVHDRTVAMARNSERSLEVRLAVEDARIDGPHFFGRVLVANGKDRDAVAVNRGV